jgi:hypothetical protein
MPYLCCRRCAVFTYRTAWRVGRDACPTCGEPLVRDARRSAAAAHLLQPAALRQATRLTPPADGAGGRWR